MKNSVSLIGRVKEDVILKDTPIGKKVAEFVLVTSEPHKDKESGEKDETLQWHNIVMWGNENVVPYLKKGTLISVDGKIVYRKWDDKKEEDKKYYKTEIVIDPFSVILLSSKKKEEKEG